MFGVSTYSQTDTIYYSINDIDQKFVELKQELNQNIEQYKNLSLSVNSEIDQKLLEYIESQRNIIADLENKLKLNKNSTNRNSSSITSAVNNIDSLIKESLELEKEISQNSNELSLSNKQMKSIANEANSKMSFLDDKFSSKSFLSFLLLAFSFLVAIGLFFLLRRKLTDNTTRFDDQLEATRKSINEEHMKLDQKLIEMLESQLKVQKQEREIDKSSNKEEDHAMALKVADEIIRMQKNIDNMPEETKGLKQLSKAIQRIQDSFKVNGYEIVEMLGKTYKEGMKLVANFVVDENLKKDEQIISRIIKPQVNYNGKMIQSAQIEVSIGE
jgi:flagellar biosynthesis/type III secretory pathway M-ring protein FliF/YscJ